MCIHAAFKHKMSQLYKDEREKETYRGHRSQMASAMLYLCDLISNISSILHLHQPR